MSMTLGELCQMSEAHVTDLLESLRSLLVKEPSKPTEEESAALVDAITHAAICLEGYLIGSLPEPACYNVRAAIEHGAQAFMRARGRLPDPNRPRLVVDNPPSVPDL